MSAFAACSRRAFSRSASTTTRSRSTITTREAPRESASKPSAPLPAKRSRHARSSRRWPSQLKSVSRTRSGVGRSAAAAGNFTMRLRHFPAMMRTRLRPLGRAVIVGRSYRKIFGFPPAAAMQSLKNFLKKDLELSRSRWSKVLGLLRSRPDIDEALYEEIESQLLQADVGVAATATLIEA